MWMSWGLTSVPLITHTHTHTHTHTQTHTHTRTEGENERDCCAPAPGLLPWYLTAGQSQSGWRGAG